MFEVYLEEKQWAELRAALCQEKLVRRAAANALNKSVAKAATAIRRDVAKAMRVPIRSLGSNAGKHRGMIRPLRANPDRLDARVRILNFGVPIIKTKQTPQRGDVLPVGQESGDVPLTNSPFQQTMPSGHLGWFVRYGAERKMQAGRYVGKKRQPIKQIFSHSPRWFIDSEQVNVEPKIAAAKADLDAQISNQIHRYLERKG